jgi:hypothetical protein
MIPRAWARHLLSLAPVRGPAALDGAVRYEPGRGPAGPQRFVLTLALRPASWRAFWAPGGAAFLRAEAAGHLRVDGLCAATAVVGRAHLRPSRRPALRLVLAFAAAGRPHLLRATARWPGWLAFARGGAPLAATIRRETDGALVGALTGRLTVPDLLAAFIPAGG